MPNTPPALVASGNILPFRAVKMSGEHKGAQCGSNEVAIGLARGGTNYAPLNGIISTNYAAQEGQPISLIGDGEIGFCVSGASFSAGNKLKSDTNGKLVPVANSGKENVVAIALEDAGAGDIQARVQVNIHTIYT